MSTENQRVIIAPHPDDEIIGNWEIITKYDSIVVYTSNVSNLRKEESVSIVEHTKISKQIFSDDIPYEYVSSPNVTFYMPDPVYETHPEHRKWGAIGEEMFRRGFDIIFYNTNMTAPYIHEVSDPNAKCDLLSKIYTSQKSLWKYEYKFFLFEGRNKWLL